MKQHPPNCRAGRRVISSRENWQTAAVFWPVIGSKKPSRFLKLSHLPLQLKIWVLLLTQATTGAGTFMKAHCFNVCNSRIWPIIHTAKYMEVNMMALSLCPKTSSTAGKDLLFLPLKSLPRTCLNVKLIWNSYFLFPACDLLPIKHSTFIQI